MNTRLLSGSLAVVGALALGACGSNTDQVTVTPTAPATTAVSGVAAVGAPLVGGAVNLSCGSGATASGTSGSDGAWSATVPTASLPCAVRISGGTIAGVANATDFYSLVRDSSAVANLTPLADLALAAAVNGQLGSTLDSWFASATDAQRQQVATALAAAVADLRTALDEAGYSLPVADFDPFIAAIVAGAAADGYDQLLEAYRQALDDAGRSYETARSSYTGGSGITQPTPTNPEPPVSTPLPDDKLGVSFDDASTAYRWLQPAGQGGVTAINGDGDGRVGVRMGDGTNGGPDGTVTFTTLPSKLGTYACGDAVGTGSVQMQVTFHGINDPRQTYVSYQDAANPDQRTLLEGYSCSVTLTHVGAFESQYIYNDDYIEGTFTAKLRQSSRECAGEGEGNCAPFKELLVNNGKFRINKTGNYTPTAGGGTGGGNFGRSIVKRVGAAWAGSYVVACPADNNTTVNRTITLNRDGSSLVDNQIVLDAGTGGQFQLIGTGFGAHTQSASQNFPLYQVQFDSSGKIQSPAYHSVAFDSTAVKSCQGVSGAIDTAALDVPAAVAAFATQATLTCGAVKTAAGSPQANSPTGSTAFAIDATGGMTLGQLAVKATDYMAYRSFKLTDRVTYPSTNPFSPSNYLLAVTGGYVTLGPVFDADGQLLSVSWQNVFDSGTCTP